MGGLYVLLKMTKIVILSLFALAFNACNKSSSSPSQIIADVPDSEVLYTFVIPEKYSLVKPIPEGDQWLSSYKKNHKYSEDSWETWVWRLTNIDVGENIKVYARDQGETQFFVYGYPELPELFIDYKFKRVDIAGYSGGDHITTVSPSRNYVVCITNNPRNYMHGLSISNGVWKNPKGLWSFSFSGNKVTWKKGKTNR